MAKKSKMAAPIEKEGGKRKPSKGDRYPYDPACCEKVVKLGADGLCAVEIRREIGLSRSAWNRSG